VHTKHWKKHKLSIDFAAPLMRNAYFQKTGLLGLRSFEKVAFHIGVVGKILEIVAVVQGLVCTLRPLPRKTFCFGTTFNINRTVIEHVRNITRAPIEY